MSAKNGKMNGKANGHVVARVENWTPAKARKQLEANTRNRPINENWVMELAMAIESDEWELNGESIKIAEDGTMEDGQHRLHAVVTADRPVDILTVRGLPVRCFDTIDQGKKRSGAHVLARHGEKNTHVLSSALVLLWRYENGALRKSGPGSRPSNAKLADLLILHPKMRDSVPVAAACKYLMPKSVAGCCHYLFGKKDSALCDEFFRQLIDGDGLTKTQGVYQLRERLIGNRKNKAKLPPLEVFALTVKAWNAHRTGSKVYTLRWRTEGDNPEEFPKVQ